MKRNKRLPSVRLTEKELNRVRLLSKLYADGNLSEWIRHSILEAPRKKPRFK